MMFFFAVFFFPLRPHYVTEPMENANCEVWKKLSHTIFTAASWIQVSGKFDLVEMTWFTSMYVVISLLFFMCLTCIMPFVARSDHDFKFINDFFSLIVVTCMALYFRIVYQAFFKTKER